MPIHIREIVVKATINEANPNTPRVFGRSRKRAQEDRESIIEECMENVLRMLKEHKDR